MQFKYYDTLSALISGMVLLFILTLAAEWDISNVNVVILLAIAFVIGYLLNAVSAVAEPIFFWFMGGKPSNRLLTKPKPNCKGKAPKYTGFCRIRFYEYEEVIRLLKDELKDDTAEPEQMFDKAKTYAIANDKTRVSDFNAHYAFSRVILTLMIISTAVLMPLYYDKWWAWLIAVGVILLSGVRCKERGYYYAREILVEYLKEKR